MGMIKVESFKEKILILCLFSFITAFSQDGKLNRADKNYEQLGFIKASEIYEKVADRGYRSAELFQKLGNTYYFNRSEEHTSELQSRENLVCRLLLEKKKMKMD